MRTTKANSIEAEQPWCVLPYVCVHACVRVCVCVYSLWIHSVCPPLRFWNLGTQGRRASAQVPILCKCLRINWVLFPFTKAKGSRCPAMQQWEKSLGRSVQWEAVPGLGQEAAEAAPVGSAPSLRL